MANYIIFFLKVPNTVNLNTLTGIGISNFLWIPSGIVPGSGQNRRWWNLTRSDWVTSLRLLIRKIIFKLSRSLSFRVRYIFNDNYVLDDMVALHGRCVVVPADGASNDVVFVCKT